MDLLHFQEIPPSPSLYTVPVEKDTEQFDQLREELNEAENEKFSLQLKVESLSENKRMSSERVDELEKKLGELQKQCNEFEKRYAYDESSDILFLENLENIAQYIVSSLSTDITVLSGICSWSMVG